MRKPRQRNTHWKPQERIDTIRTHITARFIVNGRNSSIEDLSNLLGWSPTTIRQVLENSSGGTRITGIQRLEENRSMRRPVSYGPSRHWLAHLLMGGGSI